MVLVIALTNSFPFLPLSKRGSTLPRIPHPHLLPILSPTRTVRPGTISRLSLIVITPLSTPLLRWMTSSFVIDRGSLNYGDRTTLLQCLIPSPTQVPLILTLGPLPTPREGELSRSVTTRNPYIGPRGTEKVTTVERPSAIQQPLFPPSP